MGNLVKRIETLEDLRLEESPLDADPVFNDMVKLLGELLTDEDANALAQNTITPHAARALAYVANCYFGNTDAENINQQAELTYANVC